MTAGAGAIPCRETRDTGDSAGGVGRRTVTARCVGWLYTSPAYPGAEQIEVLSEDGKSVHFQTWTKEAVYTLSELPTVEIEDGEMCQ